jgi:hypothetical protein
VTAADLDVVIGEQFLPSFVLSPISANINKKIKKLLNGKLLNIIITKMVIAIICLYYICPQSV